jgi:hypothetical protein
MEEEEENIMFSSRFLYFPKLRKISRIYTSKTQENSISSKVL